MCDSKMKIEGLFQSKYNFAIISSDSKKFKNY